MRALSGTIPNDMATLASLEFGILSDNNFSGEVEMCDLIEDTNGKDAAMGGGFQRLDVQGNSALTCYYLCWQGTVPGVEFAYDVGLESCKGSFDSNEMTVLKELSNMFSLGIIGWDFSKDASGAYLQDPCLVGWHGIECLTRENSYVVGKLDFSGVLRNLTSAYPFSDPVQIPPALPSLLDKLESLTSIDLSNNGMVGPIPQKWSLQQSLESINLSNNELTGTVPWQVFDGKITDLDVSLNSLEGELPESAFKGFTNLCAIGNAFTGSFPEITEMDEVLPVSTLLLSGNSISGTIPESYVNALNCQSGVFSALAVSSNDISGTIPQGLYANCMKMSLKHLILDDNKLTGTIPDFSVLAQMMTLTLDNNQFTGVFPDMTKNVALQILGIPLSDAMPAIPFSKLPRGINAPLFRISTTATSGAIPDLSALSPSSTYILAFTGGFKGPVSQTTMNQLSRLTMIRGLFFNSVFWTPYTTLDAFLHPKWNSYSRHNPNSFSGELPLFTSSFPTTSMYSVHMGHNAFEGVIPPKALASQRYIFWGADFCNNKFSSVDFSDTSWDTLPMISIDVAGNQITGSFEDAFVKPLLR